MRHAKKTREVVLVDYCRAPQGRGAAKGNRGSSMLAAPMILASS